jgi:hypothetical protein
VDEELFALLLVVLRERPVYRALFERVGRAVGACVVDEVVQRAALHFGEGVASQLLGGRVHVGAVLARVQHQESNGRVLEDGFELRPRLAQLRLGALAGGDVARDFRRADDAPLGVPQGRDGERDVEERAVLPSPHRLVVIHTFAAPDLRKDARLLVGAVFGD